MERYIKEYANARIKDVKTNKLMHKNLIVKKIEKVLELRTAGLITANEAIRAILEA